MPRQNSGRIFPHRGCPLVCWGWMGLLIGFGHAADLSCNVFLDRCPTTFDGVCDKLTNPSRCGGSEGNGDCFDCDECRSFDYDCDGCLSNGCYWCPGDARCFNSDAYVILNFQASCVKPDDYVSLRNPPSPDAVAASCASPAAYGNYDDPLYDAEAWAYDLIHLEAAWSFGVSGRGARVRINDNGVDAKHPEFADRFDTEASCPNHYLPQDYLESAEAFDHGTAVAAIVGAAANNGICSVGVAPGATLSSCDIFYRDSTRGDNPRTDFLDPSQFDLYDISQNSFGGEACPERNIVFANRFRELAEKQKDEPISDDSDGGDDEEEESVLSPELKQLFFTASPASSECPFQFRQRIRPDIPFPCSVCPEDFSAIPRSTTGVSQCEGSIIAHCRFFFEQDKDACLDVLDILIEGGKCQYSTIRPQMRENLVKGINEGRDGKGILFVWAAGNAYTVGEDTNTVGGHIQSRLVMAVGAVGKDGLHASYSTPGASLFVSAPGGDQESRSNHVVASVSPTTGASTCDNVGVGTSYACPVVSGVLALMLEANPDLNWREVQEILAFTSQPVTDDPNDETATINAAGYWHSNYYGFGIIHAGAAVEAALLWDSSSSPLGPEQLLLAESKVVNLPIFDDASITTTSVVNLEVPNPRDEEDVFAAESVEVMLELEHFSRGHLEISLISPQGTKSILHPGRRPENSQLDLEGGARWKFLTRKHWGEFPGGDWTLEIVDLTAGDVLDDCVDSNWSFPQGNGFEPLDCRDLESLGFCRNGRIQFGNPIFSPGQFTTLFERYKDENGVRAGDGCCACGGTGIRREDVTDQLIQWTLAVYGRQGDVLITLSPTSTPTFSPTTARPTRRPQMPPYNVGTNPSSGGQGEPTQFGQTEDGETSDRSFPGSSMNSTIEGPGITEEDPSLGDRIKGIFSPSSAGNRSLPKLSKSWLSVALVFLSMINFA